MRLTAEFFIAALVRRVFGRGGFAAVERRGATEAGAIFIRQRFRDGTENLFAPAPQTSFENIETDDRLFEPRLERVGPEAVEQLMEKEIRFDPDLWLLEIEADDIGDLVPIGTP